MRRTTLIPEPIRAVRAATAPLLALALLGAPAMTAVAQTSPPRPFVVMTSPDAIERVEAAVQHLGGRVTRPLGIIGGFAADLPARAAAALVGQAGVLSVAPDAPMQPMSIDPSLGYDPGDGGSMSSLTRLIGAQTAWANGVTGKGVDVAVVDTGVTPVSGLDAPDKVVNGPDLSFDSPSPSMRSLDAFGHGTFMASLIAGRDDTATGDGTGCTTCLNTSGYSDTTKFVGVAPDARVINVKVGAADGAADVSQVIAAIDWVTQHAHDPGVNIRVLNLSFGTNSSQGYGIDPLAYAAEQAWSDGIVVVAAAGNDGMGPDPLTGALLPLADPAYDPNILAAGAFDPATDAVPDFAQHGTIVRPVDVVAPGTHVLGLRVPGSYIDTMAGNSGQVGTRFQRGSGTSEATAITSGVVALLAQRYPSATPDQLRALIDGTAKTLLLPGTPLPVYGLGTPYAGHGMINVAAALSAPLPILTLNLALRGDGSGTLDGARGGVYVSDNGVNLTGQVDIFGHGFSSSLISAEEQAGCSWTGGIWNGDQWTGNGWQGGAWAGVTWSGTDWAGSRWSGSKWSTMSWDGSKWSGEGWAGSRWTGSKWSGSRWSSATWS